MRRPAAKGAYGNEGEACLAATRPYDAYILSLLCQLNKKESHRAGARPFCREHAGVVTPM
jgi:hypothetical protein